MTCWCPLCGAGAWLASLWQAAFPSPRRAQAAPEQTAEETVRSWSTSRIIEALNWALSDANEASAELCLAELQARAAADAAQELCGFCGPQKGDPGSELTNVNV